MCYTDSSVDCSYHNDKPSHATHSKDSVKVTALLVAAASSIIVILPLFYCLYRHRSKKSSDLVRLVQDDENDDHHNNMIIDHHDNSTNDQLAVSVQPAEEAGNSGDQLQVGLTTLTEPSQSQFSKPTMEEIIHAKFMGQYHPVPSSSKVVGFHHSNLLGTTVA